LLAGGSATSARAFLPDELDLASLREAAQGCEGCHLHEDATQTVFGEGAPDARLVLVGEQPGDQEDREGEPFVGPAGRELDGALEQAGIDRDDLYITNVVKHFKFTLRGRRRLHQTPDQEEVAACLPWLEAELEVLRPELVVCLGASAAKALIAPDVRVTKDAGKVFGGPAGLRFTAVTHPSAILRAPDERRDDARRAFREDVDRIAGWLADGVPEPQAELAPSREEQLDLF
jgi:uracil-DNA glycosylase